VGSLLPLPRLNISADAAASFRNGSARPVGEAVADDGRVAVFDGSELIGIGSVHEGVLQPEKVLPREAPA
jgi:hypothetical protein